MKNQQKIIELARELGLVAHASFAAGVKISRDSMVDAGDGRGELDEELCYSLVLGLIREFYPTVFWSCRDDDWYYLSEL